MPPGHGGEQAVPGGHGRRARVQQQEAAGAVGVLRHAGARSTPGRRARPADRPRCPRSGRRAGSQPTSVVSPIDAARGDDLGSSARGTSSSASSSSSHATVRRSRQQRARGVRGVGRVDAAAGELPRRASVSTVPKASSPRSAAAPGPGTWSSSQAILVPEKYASRTSPVRSRTSASTPAALQRVAHRGRAAALPDDRAVDRAAGRALPDDRGLALVGDTDRGDVGAGHPRLGHRAARRLAHASSRSLPGRARPSRAADSAGSARRSRARGRRPRRPRRAPSIPRCPDPARGCSGPAACRDESTLKPVIQRWPTVTSRGVRRS